MSKIRKPIVALIIALIVFIGFVGATNYYISQNVDLVKVVSASESIPPRTEIVPGMLKITEIPRGYVPDGAAPNINIFKDDTYYTGELGLFAGEIVTKEKVFTADAMEQAHTLTLAAGESIMGISTDLVRSAGASIYPGSRVRALSYIEPGGWQGADPSKVEVLFDNIRVVGVVNSEAHDTSTQEQRGRVPAVIKIAVTPEQERVLIKHHEENTIWFVVLPEGYQPSKAIEAKAEAPPTSKPAETQTTEPANSSVRTF